MNPIPCWLFEVLSPAGGVWPDPPWYLSCGTQKIPKLNFPKPKLSLELLISLLSCIASSGAALRSRRLKNVTDVQPIFNLANCCPTDMYCTTKNSPNHFFYIKPAFNPIPCGLFEVLSPAGGGGGGWPDPPRVLTGGTLKIPKPNFPKQIWS